MSKLVRFAVAFIFLSILVGCASTQKPKPIIVEPPSQATSAEAIDYVLRAATAEASGDVWQAISLYRLAADYDTSSSSILQALAELYIRVREIGPARNTIERALDLDPNNFTLLEMKSTICVSQRDAYGLNQCLTHWYEVAKDKPEQITKIAGMYFLLGDRLRSKSMYHDAIKRFGAREEWLDRYSALLIIEKDWKAAAAVLLQLASLDSSDVQRWLDAADAAIASGDTIGGKKLVDRAILIDPKDARGWRFAIMIAGLTADSLTIDSLIESGLIANPKSPDLLGLKAQKLQHEKKYEDAVAMLHRAIAEDTTRLSFYLDLGFLSHTLNKPNEAEFAYVKALSLDSNAALVLNNYAYLLATQNRDLDRAFSMVTRAVSKEPDNASYYDTRGWILYRQGKYDQAIDDLKRASRLDSTNGEIMDHLGDVYHSMGEDEDAIESWQRALDLDHTMREVKLKLDEIRK